MSYIHICKHPDTPLQRRTCFQCGDDFFICPDCAQYCLFPNLCPNCDEREKRYYQKNPHDDLRDFDAQWTPDDLEAYAQEQADPDGDYVSDNDILEASQ